jgi:hypothetical protein
MKKLEILLEDPTPLEEDDSTVKVTSKSPPSSNTSPTKMLRCILCNELFPESFHLKL